MPDRPAGVSKPRGFWVALRQSLQSAVPAYNGPSVSIMLVLFCFALSLSLAACNQTHDAKEQDLAGRSETSTRNTIEAVLQKTLDAKELQMFLHPMEPGRSTLCVTGANLPLGLSLEKHGHPVKVVNTIDECENCLVFESIEIADTTILVTIHYPIEGLRGEFYFTH